MRINRSSIWRVRQAPAGQEGKNMFHKSISSSGAKRLERLWREVLVSRSTQRESRCITIRQKECDQLCYLFLTPSHSLTNDWIRGKGGEKSDLSVAWWTDRNNNRRQSVQSFCLALLLAAPIPLTWNHWRLVCHSANKNKDQVPLSTDWSKSSFITDVNNG